MDNLITIANEQLSEQYINDINIFNKLYEFTSMIINSTTDERDSFDSEYPDHINDVLEGMALHCINTAKNYPEYTFYFMYIPKLYIGNNKIRNNVITQFFTDIPPFNIQMANIFESIHGELKCKYADNIHGYIINTMLHC